MTAADGVILVFGLVTMFVDRLLKFSCLYGEVANCWLKDLVFELNVEDCGDRLLTDSCRIFAGVFFSGTNS